MPKGQDMFQNAVDVVINITWSEPVCPSLIDVTLKGKNLEREKSTRKIDHAEKDSTDCYPAICFMLSADKL